jgi:nitrite reductase/ring-hydroxylating ferredoxin subunit
MFIAPSGESALEDKVRLCRLDEIPDGAARGFRLRDPAGREVRIFAVRRGATAYAYLNRCPHRGTPLDWTPDHLLDAEGRHLVCATHGALFRVEDGVCLAGPCVGDQLVPVPLAQEDGALYAPAELEDV